jgi:hypothetical protein
MCQKNLDICAGLTPAGRFIDGMRKLAHVEGPDEADGGSWRVVGPVIGVRQGGGPGWQSAVQDGDRVTRCTDAAAISRRLATPMAGASCSLERQMPGDATEWRVARLANKLTLNRLGSLTLR